MDTVCLIRSGCLATPPTITRLPTTTRPVDQNQGISLPIWILQTDVYDRAQHWPVILCYTLLQCAQKLLTSGIHAVSRPGHFQMHFHEWKLMYFDSNFNDVCSLIDMNSWFRWWHGTTQATSHYLNQWWPGTMSPYVVTWPQWVKTIHYQVAGNFVPLYIPL